MILIISLAFFPSEYSMSSTSKARWFSTFFSAVRYDTIEEFNVDSKAECDQLNLAHETKTNKRQCPLSSV